jgi:L-rhamnose isomerase
MSPVTHVVSVGYASVEEMASWLTIRDASADWATYQAASRKVSQYLGGSLANTARTWGSAGMKDVVVR